jgi:putative ABC transport system permease protein
MRYFSIFKKTISLRIVNFTGLSIMFTCLLLTVSYIKHELSYDRHHTNADRIVRMTLQVEGTIDGRVWNSIIELLKQLPEIEKTAEMRQNKTAILTYHGTNRVVKNFLQVNCEFLQVFDLHLLQGNKKNALNHKGQALISEKLARELFGNAENIDILPSNMYIAGQLIRDSLSVSGIFKDIPKTSHFNADLLVYLSDEYQYYFAYTYLLLKAKTDIEALAQKITKLIKESNLYEVDVHALLMPLTDIHLHSHNLQEMSVNGNINYIYLMISANILLLIIVLFNLWLNANLIFLYNRRHYQLLRLYGTTSSVVFKDEILSALLLGLLAIITGLLVVVKISSLGMDFSLFETVVISVFFLFLVICVSLIPALKGISLTQYLNTSVDLKPVRFSYSNVKYMLILQYAVVMFVVILAFGMNKQMNMVKNLQVGGNKKTILVVPDQPEQVQEKFKVLKTELLKHSEIEYVTSSMLLPGGAMIDHTSVKREDEEEWKWLHLIVANEDFLPFFNIPLIAGKAFSQGKFDYQTELSMASDFWLHQNISDHIEEYVINRKALSVLGFEVPEDAIGQRLQIQWGGVDYINKGIIVGVTDDFNYAGLYEEIAPSLIMQRNMFQHNIMVRLNPAQYQQARKTFENVWGKVNPDYPVDYVFMNDVFSSKYFNEINAQNLVFIFSLLCFLIADLGLIVFMAFIIKRRTKEIGLRKVHGASIGEILRMLNLGFIKFVAVAFVIVIPVAWYVMHRWLEQFTYQTSIAWWIFVLAGLGVVLLSILSVTLQSWRAATVNPIKAIKIE